MKVSALTFPPWMNKAIDLLLPPRCSVSGEIVPQQGMSAPHIWQQLDFIADPKCICCGFPFDFEVEEGLECTSCIAEKPPFDTARAALIYNEASRDLLLGFKHADKTHIVQTFIPWLKSAGADMLAQADYILPVPLHYTRIVARRYNQSALIALELARATGLPVLLSGLRRVRATPPQGHLTAKEREKNVRRAFAVLPKHKDDLKGKTVILVDDVYTTGATLKECAAALRRAGVAHVHALSVARVCRGSANR